MSGSTFTPVSSPPARLGLCWASKVDAEAVVGDVPPAEVAGESGG
jgi:hypothetical protein